jgi:hypothetical protein
MKEAREKGVRYLDFVGGRINPEEDSKLFRIQKYKEQMGGVLHSGYLWKMTINKNKRLLFDAMLKVNDLIKKKKSKDDIIDQEIKRFNLQGEKS